MTTYYNEIDDYAATWIENLIADRLIPSGHVDRRSIEHVQPADLAGFRQCHFFAGIAGWALAARLAGWPDDRELWTGSCPCQPFSVAGKQRGTDDERHLWPHQFRLLSACRPAVWMGEQVAAAIGKDWIDGVLSDLEGIDYAGRAVVVPACAVDGPHRRDRIWIVAGNGAMGHGKRTGLERYAGHGDDTPRRAIEDRPAAASGSGGHVSDPAGDGREQGQHAAEGSRHGRFPAAARGTDGAVADAELFERPVAVPGAFDQQKAGGRIEDSGEIAGCGRSPWGGSWIIGHDGKARRVPGPESGIRLLAHGIPARVGRLRAYGNAIVPQVAAEVIAAWMDCAP